MSARPASSWRALLVVLALLQPACRRSAPEPDRTDVRVASPALAPPALPPAATSSARAAEPVRDGDTSYRSPAPARLVAIGDLHGDLKAARATLRLAKAIDDHDGWIGGKLVVVQTGDEIDRADDDRAILELFDRLADAAQAAGGNVRPLVGNHEVMNVSGDFRYVTPAALGAFGEIDSKRVPAPILAQVPSQAHGRLAAFFPGGPFALRLARRDAIAVVGDTVFVHGGVSLEHVRYGIGRFNRELKRWMAGEGPSPVLATDEQGPLWTRRYSDDKSGLDCPGLAEALRALGAKRMVVGHTVHEEGISSACDGRVWRIDTGLSAFYGGPMEILEIQGDQVTVLRAK
jgi:hypothetical protein